MEKTGGEDQKKMQGLYSAMAASYMVKKSKGQLEVERSGEGLLRAVEVHKLGIRIMFSFKRFINFIVKLST